MLPGLVKRRYEDVKSFHESVVRNRKDYLSSELEAAKLRIELRDSKKAQLDQRRGEILGILKSHGALEQFLAARGIGPAGVRGRVVAPTLRSRRAA